MAMVIELVAPGTTLPLVSSTATCTEGIIEAPAFVLVGWHQESQLIRRENYVERRAYGGCQTRCACVQRVANSCSTESQVGEGHYAFYWSTRYGSSNCAGAGVCTDGHGDRVGGSRNDISIDVFNRNLHARSNGNADGHVRRLCDEDQLRCRPDGPRNRQR